MANVATQFGFKHQGYLGGGAVDYQPTPYPIRSGYSTVINFCDPVIFSSDGTITLATPTVTWSVLSPMRTVPKESSIFTVTAGLMATPAVEVVGC